MQDDNLLGTATRAISNAPPSTPMNKPEDAQTDLAVRTAIIEWLGHAYDPERQYLGNPDYRQPEDVDVLVTVILGVLAHSAETTGSKHRT